MKKTISRLVCFIAALSLVWACAGFQDNRLATLSATLKLDMGSTLSKSIGSSPGDRDQVLGKVIMPSEPWTPVRYRVSGAGPGGAEFSIEGTQLGVETKLVPGEWAITVQAYSADGKEVAKGTSQCLLQPGRTTAVTIILYPLDGTGDISLTIVKTFELPSGARITGSLTHKGLPGQQAPSTPTIFPVDIPAEQSALPFASVPAGHYALALQLIASDGVVSGGCAQTLMVVAGFQTASTCAIEMGMPANVFSAEFYPSSPLDSPLMSVGHGFSDTHKAMPLAISPNQATPGEEMERVWYLNGEEVGPAVPLIGNLGLLPEGTLAFPQSPLPYPVSLLRADLVEASPTTFRSGSGSVTLEASPGNDCGGCGWRASYDYKAATYRSLFDIGLPHNTGKGEPYAVKAVAASPSGLILVSGLDEEGAIHAFAAGYGAEIDPSVGSGSSTLSLDASWMRLWRDRTKINSTYRTADRLAISEDGRFFAAASAASNWLRVSVLNDGGMLLRSFSLTQIADGFQNIKALCFSPNGQRLYALASSSNTVYAFDVSESACVPGSALALSKATETETLSLQDLKVTPSGDIIVSASEASRIYILSDENGLEERYTIQGSTGGTSPYKPGSIAVSRKGDAFYVLCDEEEIARYSRTEITSPYTLASVNAVPSGAEGVGFLVSGLPLGDVTEFLFAAGNGIATFLKMGDTGSVEASYSFLEDSWDLAGVSATQGICFTRGAFILGGGSTGIVSVFGIE